jgi:hypothetical protein
MTPATRLADIQMPHLWVSDERRWHLQRTRGKDVEELSCADACFSLHGDLAQRGDRVVFVPKMTKAQIVAHWDEHAYGLYEDALADIGVTLEATDYGSPR